MSLWTWHLEGAFGSRLAHKVCSCMFMYDGFPIGGITPRGNFRVLGELGPQTDRLKLLEMKQFRSLSSQVQMSAMY